MKRPPIDEKLLETVINHIKRKDTSQSRSKAIEDEETVCVCIRIMHDNARLDANSLCMGEIVGECVAPQILPDTPWDSPGFAKNDNFF